jgi:YbbR domain-containing protein
VTKILLENIWWKLASLAVAIALWATLILEPDVVTSASVSVFFRNLPRDLEFATQAPDHLVLEVRGPAGKLGPDSLRDIAVQVDLSNVRSAGEQTFTIDRSNITLPFGVTLVRAVPSQLRMRFDKQLTKQIPVRVRYQSNPPVGWHVYRESVTPETLRIIGPATRVDQIEYAETDPVDIQWQPGEKTIRVHVFAGDPQVRFESSPMVTVKALVERASQQP